MGMYLSGSRGSKDALEIDPEDHDATWKTTPENYKHWTAEGCLKVKGKQVGNV